MNLSFKPGILLIRGQLTQKKFDEIGRFWDKYQTAMLNNEAVTEFKCPTLYSTSGLSVEVVHFPDWAERGYKGIMVLSGDFNKRQTEVLNSLWEKVQDQGKFFPYRSMPAINVNLSYSSIDFVCLEPYAIHQ